MFDNDDYEVTTRTARAKLAVKKIGSFLSYCDNCFFVIGYLPEGRKVVTPF